MICSKLFNPAWPLFALLRLTKLGFLGGIFGGGSKGGSSPFHPYSPTGLGQEDTNWQTLFTDIMANSVGPGTYTALAGSELDPTFNYIEQILAGPLGQGTQAMSAYAGQYDYGLASQADAIHNLMTNQGNIDYANQAKMLGAGDAVWNTALDPQKALYDRTLQQVQQQARGSSTAHGLAMGPQAAGVENQATDQFNIDWQNQQLQRELSGLQGMGGAYKQAGQEGVAGNQSMTQALQTAGSVPQLLQESAMLPYKNAMSLGQASYANSANLMNAGNATLQPFYQMLHEIIPYMNYGAGAQSNAFGAGQSNLSNLGTLASMGTDAYKYLSGLGGGSMASPFIGSSGFMDPTMMSGIAGMIPGMEWMGAGAGALGGGMAAGEGLGALSWEEILPFLLA